MCHHCSEKGHIRPKCPKYLADIESGKTIRANLRDSKRKKNLNTHLLGLIKVLVRAKWKTQKSRLFSHPFNLVFTNEDDDDNKRDNGGDNVDDKEDDGNDDNNNDDLHGFLSMIGSLKE